jgi:hypothetical protein
MDVVRALMTRRRDGHWANRMLASANERTKALAACYDALTAAADFRAIEWTNNAATAPSASWGLYGAGSAPNYLNGRLGIGTIAPAYQLHISSSTGDASIYLDPNPFFRSFIYTGTNWTISTPGEVVTIDGGSGTNYGIFKTGTYLGVSSYTTLRFYTNQTRRATFFQNGNLAINSTSDSGELLQVAGSTRLAGNTFVSGTLDILDAEINYQRNNNVTTGSARLIASIPTASLNAAFFDYVIVSGSNARAGTVTSVWVSSSVEWNETYTNDIGSTSDVTLYSAITGSSIGLFATSSINNVWTIKSLIRTI